MAGILDSLKGLLGGGAPAAPPEPEVAPVSVDGTIGVRVELTEEMKSAAKDLLRIFENEADEARRRQVEVVSKAHAFYAGDQYGVVNRQTGLYAQIPTHASKSPTAGEANSAYVMNFYQGFCDSEMALIAANLTTEKPLPANPNNPRSVKAAKEAEQVLRLFDYNNETREQLKFEFWHLFNDATYGTYVRHVRDGTRFGYTKEPVLEQFEQVIDPGDFMNPPVTAPGWRQATDPETGEPMFNKIPNGCEIKDIVGILELRIPPAAKNQWQYAYIGWVCELPISKVKSSYPEVADQIVANEIDGLGENANERLIRLRAAMGVDADGRQRTSIGTDLVTFRRYWFRPWAFWAFEDENLRLQFEELFPDGMYVEFAGSTLCAARNESMDDHWRICHAKPGDGQIRDAIGKSIIPAQEISNDLLNIQRDAAEFGLSAIFADTGVVNLKQFAQSKVRAGAIYPATAHGEKPLNQSFYATPAAQISPQSVELRNECNTTAPQFLVGAFPAAFGGDTGGNDTAHGIAIERDAAMGRIGLHWGTIKEHHAEVAPLVVKAFVEGRTDTVTMPQAAAGGKYKALEINPNDIDLGEIAPRYETLEDYPTSWPQRKDALTNILQGPAGPVLMQDPANYDEIKRTLGVTGVMFPGEAEWNKEMNVIDMLLKQQPVPVGPGIGPMGMPDPFMPPQMGPSIPLDPVLDTPPIVLQAIKSWAASEDGQEAAMQNPAGYQNVRLRAEMAMMAMAPPPMPGGPGGPPGEGPPGPTGPGGEPPPEQPDRPQASGPIPVHQPVQ